MFTPNWQLKTAINTVIFDCDGTLSAIEGIDELANKNNVTDKVKALTAEAMGKTGIYPELYQTRLDLVRPTQADVVKLTEAYFANLSGDVKEVIQIFKRLGKKICVVSAGVNPAVSQFGAMLGIFHENIFAVDLTFDSMGNYVDFDRHSPMITASGKRDIVTQLKQTGAETLFVGDGLNDLAVIDLVARFVGYGGSFYRDNIASRCEFYIQTLSMAALLPLALTAEEFLLLEDHEKALYLKGMKDIELKRVLIQSL
ncbi:MAG: HAD-IB family phosphatase [Gammaproteobacteria bacterium]|nr:HAD-IB family phosphatase [Gammaproteobacteria bacterium]